MQEVRFVQPPVPRWMLTVLGGLFGLYFLELILMNLRVDLSPLMLLPVGHGLMPWQPVTRFLVQGGGGALFNASVDVTLFPDYTSVISEPMDFCTIGSKLENKAYAPNGKDELNLLDGLKFTPC